MHGCLVAAVVHSVVVPPLAKLKIFFNPSLLVRGSNHGGTAKNNQDNIFCSLTVRGGNILLQEIKKNRREKKIKYLRCLCVAE